MITAKIHVIGNAHQARYAEDFDVHLSAVIKTSNYPEKAAEDLDELALLDVLAHYAAAGYYDPAADPEPGWALHPDGDDPRYRSHHYVIFHKGERVDVVEFEGVAITPDQTIVRTARVQQSDLNRLN